MMCEWLINADTLRKMPVDGAQLFCVDDLDISEQQKHQVCLALAPDWYDYVLDESTGECLLVDWSSAEQAGQVHRKVALRSEVTR